MKQNNTLVVARSNIQPKKPDNKNSETKFRKRRINQYRRGDFHKKIYEKGDYELPVNYVLINRFIHRSLDLKKPCFYHAVHTEYIRVS